MSNNKIKYSVIISGITYGDSDLPYNLPAYNIVDGVWTITSYDDILIDLDNAIQKINISNGGNIATGYTFGFSVVNDDFIKQIDLDGAFFNNRKCVLYLDTGDGRNFVNEWVGVVDSYTRNSETSVKFKCIDSVKSNNTSMGSDSIPIALNRNYNCKLVERSDVKNKYDLTSVTSSIIDIKVKYCLVKSVDALYSSGYSVKLETTLTDFPRLSNAYMKVIGGEGSGNIIKIRDTGDTVLTPTGQYTSIYFHTDEDVTFLKTKGYPNQSIIEIFDYSKEYNVSQNSVSEVHTDLNSKIRKPLVSYSDSSFEKLSSPDCYIQNTSYDNEVIDVYGIDKNGVFKNNSSIDLTFEELTLTSVVSPFIKFVTITYTLARESLIKISEIYKDSNTFLSLGVLRFNDIATDSTFDISELTIENKIDYYFDFGSSTITQYSDDDPFYNGFSAPAFCKMDGFDLIIDTTNMLKTTFDGFTIEDVDLENLDHIKSLSGNLTFKTFAPNPLFDQSKFEISETKAYFNNDVSIDDISIGVNGENVQLGNEYETVCDTIKYIQTEYGGVDLADIDTTSYSNADAEFYSFPSDTVRNPAKQIIKQEQINEVLKDILYYSHLGMYISRSGQYEIKNWLPYSTVFFNNILPVSYFNEANCINISDISRDDITTIASDFELKYDYNEANGEYQNTIRIKNTNLPTFDFERDVEGVSSLNSKIAEEAWLLLRSGYLRTKKISETKKESEWIKAFYSDGTGEGEALAFIRNQAGHINRQHEYLSVTIPYNSNNLALELLSFISIRDQKITGNVERLGWVIERKINTKKDSIELKLLLDISATDPYLVEIGVTQDDSNEIGNEWVDDSTATDEINDGDGK